NQRERIACPVIYAHKHAPACTGVNGYFSYSARVCRRCSENKIPPTYRHPIGRTGRTYLLKLVCCHIIQHLLEGGNAVIINHVHPNKQSRSSGYGGIYKGCPRARIPANTVGYSSDSVN